MKKYYAVESGFGFIFVGSEYGQPTLHIFNSKKEREDYAKEHDVENGNINHRCWVIEATTAYKYYSHIVDGIREWSRNVIEH